MEYLTEKQASAYSPNALAFYGDSVYEELVRRDIVLNHQTNSGRLHEYAVAMVRASFQSRAVSVIESMLSEQEADILRRGRNASGLSVPKSAKPAEYRRATGLEALFGYLKLTGNEQRIEQLFDAIINETKSEQCN